MNWFTGAFIALVSYEKKKRLAEEDTCCEHVQADYSLAYHIARENDTWGTVSSHVSCKECHEKAEEEEGDELVTCFDCQREVKQKDTISWRWYDFYAPQGDEPLIICDSCRVKEKHIYRVRKDRDDYEQEMSSYERSCF